MNASDYDPWQGKFVKNAYDDTKTDKDETLDIEICMMLKAQNRVFKIEKHVHNYPHCWRTDKPVLYYPLDSWFIRTTACRERMIELNNTINWETAEHGYGTFRQMAGELARLELEPQPLLGYSVTDLAYGRW